MAQYAKFKKECGDSILLYRVGDFYETFFDDAVEISKVLGITLTSRNNGVAGQVPLAGFPCHALERYVARLVKAGLKVAVADQTEDAKNAKTIVKRDITEIITPGTAIDEALINEAENNYLCAICIANSRSYIAYSDITTGKIVLAESSLSDIENYLLVLNPSEVIVSEKHRNEIFFIKLKNSLSTRVVFTYRPDYFFSTQSSFETLCEHFKVSTLSGFGLQDDSIQIVPAALIVLYLQETKKKWVEAINTIACEKPKGYMHLDYNTIRNLELVEPLNSDDKNATLFNILKKCSTPMGTRLLKNWIKRPLNNKKLIDERLEAVEYLSNDPFLSRNVEALLKNISDIERISGRLGFRRVVPRDLRALNMSLKTAFEFTFFKDKKYPELLRKIAESISDPSEINQLIENSIKEDAQVNVREGNIIKDGFNSELDELRNKIRNSKNWLLELEEKEKRSTGITSLKINFNRVFGYYIEVTRTHLAKVPANYIRKQTLANAERYITEELKKEEEIIINAEDRLNEIEYNIFTALVEKLAGFTNVIREISDKVAIFDVLISLSQVAKENCFVRPEITEGDKIVIKKGRHPVIEKLLADEEFIANDTYLDNSSSRIMVITGPNMAGKSTYLRQIALITVMAHIGSFVPAERAEISLTDRIFTRIGAYDRLAKGQSTFLVEMTEVAEILHNATKNSLILLDEVGRGTSTFDGLSIAWAIVEYINNNNSLKSKTIFATHYHELTEIVQLYDGIVNYNVSIERGGDDLLVFLRKINPGAAGDSYGIDVARLAGIPDTVINRAREILRELEKFEISVISSGSFKMASQEKSELELFSSNNLAIESFIQSIKKINPDNMTPIEALNFLYKLKNDTRKL